ncbi:putative RNA-binding protein Luc7-like 2 [Histomonas meleagridis]|uniref:putative RNA-binding protein Luc7-like 2 n=1 Tax=Histomonas meleagridis TaxID=135588 RepID=UPI003559C31A|nr:putative RNA-binding protein Luc7-like 2 [Histomonas meleagridis]KAH0800016.1 putative RNA-binding protein Luc7-like 2 [Histomonas meleagridis]
MKYTSYKYAEFEKMLDDWMGADRNGDSAVDVITDYNDERICKLDLAGCCPYTLLLHTRMARQPCRYKICPAPKHLKEKYQKDRNGMKTTYDQQLYDILEGILRLADKHIAFSKNLRDNKASEHQENPQLREMEKRAKALLEQCRECGVNGDVARARALYDNADTVKQQYLNKEDELRKINAEKESKITICEVCTAVIKQSDMEGRMAEHVEGRQHKAYLKMREVFETLKSAGVVSKRRRSSPGYRSRRASSERILQPLDD